MRAHWASARGVLDPSDASMTPPPLAGDSSVCVFLHVLENLRLIKGIHLVYL